MKVVGGANLLSLSDYLLQTINYYVLDSVLKPERGHGPATPLSIEWLHVMSFALRQVY